MTLAEAKLALEEALNKRVEFVKEGDREEDGRRP